MSETLNRRKFLSKSALTGLGLTAVGNILGPAATARSAPIKDSTPTEPKRTLLAIGAHYDDCPFGIPGILLEAVRKQYRVVILNIIGDYTHWAPVRDRANDLLETSIRLAAERGMEMQFLNYASMQFEFNQESKRALAEVVAEIQPDIAFMLWRRDRHPDHEVASRMSEAALRQPGMILGRSGIRTPRRIYYYDNGPGHTVDFEPDTYVDISTHWSTAMEWLGRNMAFVRKQTYDPESPNGPQAVKEKLAAYRGMACGVKYAEALRSYKAYPNEIL